MISLIWLITNSDWPKTRVYPWKCGAEDVPSQGQPTAKGSEFDWSCRLPGACDCRCCSNSTINDYENVVSNWSNCDKEWYIEGCDGACRIVVCKVVCWCYCWKRKLNPMKKETSQQGRIEPIKNEITF